MRRRGAGEPEAREVVGLYGDPDATWGIAVEVGLDPCPGAEQVREGLEALLAAHPHLGPRVHVESVAPGDWCARREELVASAYPPGAPLVRLAVAPVPGGTDGLGGGRLLVAAHHGVCDGLGLLAVAGAATGTALRPAARGIGDARAPGSFVGGSLARVWEALRDPPPRFRAEVPDPPAPPTGRRATEELAVLTVPRRRTGTIELCVALAGAFAAQRPGEPAVPLFVVGASRRAAGTTAPDRQTAYFRFRVDPAWDPGTARARFRALDPEPDFPTTSVGGLGPRVMRLLRGRLGSTATVSNLGLVHGPVRSLAMFPAVSGPQAVAVGLASTEETTTVTVRTRSTEFGPGGAQRLLDQVAARLPGSSAPR
jgi:hypothetical protein